MDLLENDIKALHRATITIDVPFHGIKKNNRQIFGRGSKKWIGKSDRLRSAENYLILKLKSWRNEYNFQTVNTRMWVKFKFYMDNFYNKDGSRNKKIGDLSNLIELPQDALQMAGIILDDGLIDRLDGSERLHAIENKLEIHIYEIY